MLHVYLTTYIHKDNNGVVSVVSFCVFFLFRYVLSPFFWCVFSESVGRARSVFFAQRNGLFWREVCLRVRE